MFNLIKILLKPIIYRANFDKICITSVPARYILIVIIKIFVYDLRRHTDFHKKFDAHNGESGISLHFYN